jgi:adenosylhomocysteine nucleosidase
MNVEAARAQPQPASDERTAVVAALREELRPLLRRAQVTETLRLGELTVHRGRIAGRSALIAETGDGPRRAAEGLRILVDRFAIDRLIVIGVSGGLSADLEPGALVVASAIRDGRCALPAPDAPWIERALDRSSALAGSVLAADRVLCSRADKRRGAAALSASGPAVVDLESAAYARVAAESGIPYTVLRAVSDAADEPLPLDFNRHRVESGALDRAGILRHALLHPALIGPLWRLRRRVALCAERLADVVCGLLEERS